MRRLKKLLSGALALTMLFTSVPVGNLTAYASVAGGNAAGGGSAGGSATGRGGDSSGLGTNSQGYRITFVDSATGQRYGDSLDILTTTPSAQVIYVNCAGESARTGSPKYLTFGQVSSKLQALLGSQNTPNPTPPPWLLRWDGQSAESESESFKEWFQSETATALLSGDLAATAGLGALLSQEMFETVYAADLQKILTDPLGYGRMRLKSYLAKIDSGEVQPPGDFSATEADYRAAANGDDAKLAAYSIGIIEGLNTTVPQFQQWAVKSGFNSGTTKANMENLASNANFLTKVRSYGLEAAVVQGVALQIEAAKKTYGNVPEAKIAEMILTPDQQVRVNEDGSLPTPKIPSSGQSGPGKSGASGSNNRAVSGNNEDEDYSSIKAGSRDDEEEEPNSPDDDEDEDYEDEDDEDYDDEDAYDEEEELADLIDLQSQRVLPNNETISSVETAYPRTLYAGPGSGTSGSNRQASSGTSGGSGTYDASSILAEIQAKQYQPEGERGTGYCIPIICLTQSGEFNANATNYFGKPVGEMLSKYMNNEISAVVEPVAWFYPLKFNTTTRKSVISGKKFYGTALNWSQSGMDPSSNGMSMGHYKAVNGAFLTAMRLEMDEASAAITAPFDKVGGRTPVSFNGHVMQAGVAYTATKGGGVIGSGELQSLFNSGVGNGFHLYFAKFNPNQQLPPPQDPGGNPPTEPGAYTVIKYYQKTSLFMTVPLKRTIKSQASHQVDITSEDPTFEYQCYFVVPNKYTPPEEVTTGTWAKANEDNPANTWVYAGSAPGGKDIDPDGSHPGRTICILYEKTGVPEQPIDTYDIDHNPDKPAGSEKHPNGKDKPDNPEKYPNDGNQNPGKGIIIDKHYRIKNSDNSFVTISHFISKGNPHQIRISEEIDKTGYRLMEYHTANDNWYIEEGHEGGSGFPNITMYEDKIVPHNDHQFENSYAGSGTIATTITIPPDTSNVLHILYEKPPRGVIEQNHYYDEENHHLRDDPEKPLYENTDYNPYRPDDPPAGFEKIYTKLDGGPEDPADEITIPPTTKRVDVYYRKKSRAIFLTSDELSYNYKASFLTYNVAAQVWDYYDGVDSHHRRSGHDVDECEHWCRSCDDYHTRRRGYRWTRFTDDAYSATVEDKNDYASSTTFLRDTKTIGRYSNTGDPWKAQKLGSSGKSNPLTPDLAVLLYRDRAEDVVTLMKNKNSQAVKDAVATIGVSTESYRPSGRRIAAQMKGYYSSKFTKHFDTHFGYTTHDQTISYLCTRTCSKHAWTHTDSDPSAEIGASADYANEFYTGKAGENKQNVREFYYVGHENKSVLNPTDDSSDFFGDDFKKFDTKSDGNYQAFNAQTTVNFYPYNKMVYYQGTFNGSNGGKQDVNVVSENISRMGLNAHVQVGLYKSTPINIKLSSTQWSTHMNSLDFIKKNNIKDLSGKEDKQTVGVGGMTQELSFKDSGTKTLVAIRSWLPYVPERQEAMNSVLNSGDVQFKGTYNEALKADADMFKAAKVSLSGYGLVQTMKPGFDSSIDSVINADKLHNKTSISWLSNSGNTELTREGETSHDTKYYMKHDTGKGKDKFGYDATGSSRANFDVLDSSADTGVKLQLAFTIYSDVDGNVNLEMEVKQNKTGRTLSNRKWSITKDQKASDLIKQDPSLKVLDNNTKMITSFVGENMTAEGSKDGAIDRNQCKNDKNDTGTSGINNYSRLGNTFNDAFDGVSYLYTLSTIEIGFGGANIDRRTNVVDALLPDYAQSKGDLYNFDKVRSSIYRTEETPNQPAAKQTKGYLSTLTGYSTIKTFDISFKNPSHLAYTKLWYLANASVDDLS